MDYEAERSEMVETGRRLWMRGLVTANDGNLSVKLDEGRFLCTPTGVSKGFMQEADLCVIDETGRRVSGPTDPSSEIRLHLRAYATRADANAVVHAHPPHATAFAVAEQPLTVPTMTEVVVSLVGAPLAPFAPPSSEALAESIVPFIGESDAVLLAHHGAVTVGADLEEAAFRMETLDHYARILIAARQIGGEVPLGRAEVEQLLDLRRRMGLSGGRMGVAELWRAQWREEEG